MPLKPIGKIECSMNVTTQQGKFACRGISSILCLSLGKVSQARPLTKLHALLPYMISSPCPTITSVYPRIFLTQSILFLRGLHTSSHELFHSQTHSSPTYSHPFFPFVHTISSHRAHVYYFIYFLRTHFHYFARSSSS